MGFDGDDSSAWADELAEPHGAHAEERAEVEYDVALLDSKDPLEIGLLFGAYPKSSITSRCWGWNA
jgi:hypothetical protein